MIIYKGQYKEDIKVSEKTTHRKQERDDITDSVDHAHGTNNGNGTISLADKSSENQVQAVKLKVENAKMEKCPSCGEKALVNENGCFVCKSCGYTKCS